MALTVAMRAGVGNAGANILRSCSLLSPTGKIVKNYLLAYLENMQKVTYVSLAAGAVTVAASCLMSRESPATVVRGAALLAIVCNALSVLWLVLARKSEKPDWKAIIKKLRSDQLNPWRVLFGYLPFMVGYSVMLFWAGWFLFGGFAIGFLRGWG